MSDTTEHDGNAWSSRAKWTFAAFAIIAAFFVLAEHRAHVLPFLPWLILLACPLMHMFMHGGHGSHGGDHGGGNHPRDGNGGPAGTRPEASMEGGGGAKRESRSHHGGRP